jgi:hypothetical protein
MILIIIVLVFLMIVRLVLSKTPSCLGVYGTVNSINIPLLEQ